jgi:limonene 1,2-monooxygenase
LTHFPSLDRTFAGGFGCYLTIGADFADWVATLRSYESMAQYVMPHFKGQIVSP